MQRCCNINTINLNLTFINLFKIKYSQKKYDD